ncbi:MAG: acylphosphatase [bacterium]|jgi:acylphosphatase
MQEKTKQIRITVQGRVQGVFYRKSTEQRAKRMELYGTVQNLENGDVEIVAYGLEEQLQKFEEWCWTGSPLSNVSEVLVSDEEPNHQFTVFSIIR